MVSFIDDQRDQYSVEGLCHVLPISPSSYYEHKARQRDPGRLPERLKKDRWQSQEIERVHRDNYGVYGAPKVWRQLNREGIRIARCTVERLMKQLGLSGAVRGRRCKTTHSDDEAERPRDLVKRQFVADRPNQLWVADITFVSTWRGFAYVAFVIDVYSRFIVGWRVANHLRTDLVLDALEQALWARKPNQQLVHHSDRGSQYLSIKYTERLAQAGVDASVGSVGNSYDNALAETINGLYKTELINKQGPWKKPETVEFETLKWVDWFNHRRLLEPIGDRPPAEYEQLYYDNEGSAEVA